MWSTPRTISPILTHEQQISKQDKLCTFMAFMRQRFIIHIVFACIEISCKISGYPANYAIVQRKNKSDNVTQWYQTFPGNFGRIVVSLICRVTKCFLLHRDIWFLAINFRILIHYKHWQIKLQILSDKNIKFQTLIDKKYQTNTDR